MPVEPRHLFRGEIEPASGEGSDREKNGGNYSTPRAASSCF
jgi:hypothetical protein